MTAPVDVQAVMKSTAAGLYSVAYNCVRADLRTTMYERAEEFDKVCAAVAELIEADHAFDEAVGALRRMEMAGPRHGSYGTGWELRDAAAKRDLMAACDAAHARRVTALANCGGA